MPLKSRKKNPKSASKFMLSSSDSVNSLDNDLNVIYKLKNPCKFLSCRRNCKSNPLCLSGLGESHWLFKNQSELETSFEDPKELCREPGTHVGLQNLGATCYVNSLLQLWFHTPQFRKAIFDWNPLEDNNEQNNPTVLDFASYHPTSEIGYLQALFSLMSCSKRAYLDPREFVQSLGLDTTTQQDAQEFSKLFISLLESNLKSQSSSHVKNLVSDNFEGQYSYVTRCSKCKTKSISPSLFYELELNVKGHRNLDESLSEFLKEEKLNGANCYSCAVCDKKQEAARYISIQKLPPILNFQLMRFVYDRQKGDKKKLNTALQFPEILDMGKYVEGAKEEGVLMYQLSAVLAHRGLSANSGHYIAYILDNDSGNWYTFNDEHVEKNTDGKKLKLKLDEDDECWKNNGGTSRVPKGFLSSTKAYMLVYRALPREDQKTESGVGTITLCERLQEYINRHNQQFDSWVEETLRLRISCVESGIEFREQMRSLINSLPPPENSDWSMVEAISTNWICHWLKCYTDKTDPIDNSKIVCSHGSLNPDHVTNVKYVSKQAAEELYNRYGGGPRLKGEIICCRECTNSRTRRLYLKNKLSDDSKLLNLLLKTKMEEDEPGFWVEKESLKNWKSKVELNDDDTGLNLNFTSNDEIKDSNGLSLEPREQITNQPDVRSLMEQNNGLYDGQKDSAVRTFNENIGDHSAVSSGNQHQASDHPTRKVNDRGEFSEFVLEHSNTNEKKSLSCAKTSLRNFRKRLKSGDGIEAKTGEEHNFPHDFSSEEFITGHSVNGDISSDSSDYSVLFHKMDSILERLNSELVSTENCKNSPDIERDWKLLNAVYSVLKSRILMGEICNGETYNSNNKKIENTMSVSESVPNSNYILKYSNTLEEQESKNLQDRSSSKPTEESIKEDYLSSSQPTEESIKEDSRSSSKPTEESIKEDSRSSSKPTEESIKEDSLTAADHHSSADSNGAIASDNVPETLSANKLADDGECIDKNGKGVEKPSMPEDMEGDYEDDNCGLPFNDGIVCSHGNLCIDESVRRLVSFKVWEILRKYFPNCRTFTHEAVPCQQCQSLACEDQVAKDKFRKEANIQKELLKDLFIGRNRPLKLLPGTYYFVPKDQFIVPWRAFLRKPEEETALKSLRTSSFLCQHGKMMYHPEIDQEKFCLLREDEWKVLADIYSVDATVTCTCKDDAENEIEPELCYPCIMERHEAEEKAQLDFESANVYVHKVNAISLPTIPEADSSAEPMVKKVKLCGEMQLQLLKQKSSSFARRSSRRKKIRGERAIQVSSTTLVRDFKVLVMNAFNVATYDQYLVTDDGKVLKDNMLTFRQLEIYPESTIYLKVEEEFNDMEETSLDGAKREPEAGFKGTKLFS